MYSYDTNDKPPAPCLSIRVINPNTQASHSILAKIDTGASISVLPATLVTDSKLEPEGRVRVAGYDGSLKWLPTYTVAFDISGYLLHDVEVISTQRRSVLLGRDILNHFIITLHGKNLTFDLRDP